MVRPSGMRPVTVTVPALRLMMPPRPLLSVPVAVTDGSFFTE